MSPRQLILGTAGHIDHGKTALVRALTGVDTDRLPQEKARGITIDIGFADLTVDAYHLGIVDVPGHERFIKNMLAGASGIDLAMLVIAADDSVMPQTREHLDILDLLGVRHGVIALSKCDLAEPEWIAAVEEEIRELVQGTFLADAAIVRTSATRGDGLEPLRTALAAAAGGVEPHAEDAPFRLAVDRSFVQQGVGTVITGTVSSGSLGPGEPVAWMPGGEVVRVRGLQTHGAAVDRVGRGQRAAINLMGVHHTAIRRGHEIAAPGYLRSTNLLTVRLRLLAESPRPLRHRARLRLHLGTQEVMTRVSLLESNVVEPGAWAYAQLATTEPTVAIGGQPFVVRTESPLMTIGGGHVIQPVARRIRRRDVATRDRLPHLHANDDAVRVAAIVRLHETGEWTTLDLARDATLSVERVERLIHTMTDDATIAVLTPTAGRTVRLHADVVAELGQHVLSTLAALHEETPLAATVSRTRLTRRCAALGAGTVITAIVGHLIETGRVVGDEQRVALADFEPQLTGGQADLRRRILETYETRGFSPPDLAELAAATGEPEVGLRALLDLCAHAGDLVHLGGGVYLRDTVETELRRRLTEAFAGEDGLTMAKIRDVLGTTRKYALPICEYLDRTGFTRRVGDVRVLRGARS